MKILIDSRDLALIVYRIEILERILIQSIYGGDWDESIGNARIDRPIIRDLEDRVTPSYYPIGNERIEQIQREIEDHELSGSESHETS